MSKKEVDQKQPEENTEFVKETNNPKQNYIFQNSGITKIGFWIIIGILVLITIGLLVSGVFFEASSKNP